MSPKLLLVLLACSAALHGETDACADLTRFQIPGFAITITKTQTLLASAAAKDIPTQATDAALFSSYCRADGVLDPRTGVEGKKYSIGFSVAMPDNWNGRFLMQGGGALNGTIQEL